MAVRRLQYEEVKICEFLEMLPFLNQTGDKIKLLLLAVKGWENITVQKVEYPAPETVEHFLLIFVHVLRRPCCEVCAHFAMLCCTNL